MQNSTDRDRQLSMPTGNREAKAAWRIGTAFMSLTRVFVRYLGVQAVGYAIDMGLFLALLHATTPLYANLTSKTITVLFGFFANRYFTFRVHGREHGRSQLIKYAALAGLAIPIANMLFHFLAQWLSPLALAKFASDVLCMGLNS
jgi:putative flippase GtrA